MRYKATRPNNQRVERESESWMRECARHNGFTGWQNQHPDLGFNSKVEFKLERDGDEALFEVKAFTTMRIWDAGFAAMERNDGKTTAFNIENESRALRAQVQRARKKFIEHRTLGLPSITVLANPGNADVSLDIEGLLTALYGDLVMSAGTGQTGIEIDPSLWESDDVTSAFLTLNGPRAVLVLHTPAAIDGRCPRLSRAWFPDAEQWEWEPHTQTFARI